MASVHSVTITPDAAHAGVERFCGFSIRDDAAGACVIQFRAGTVGGQVLAFVALASGESKLVKWSGDDILEAPGGVFVNEVSGSIEGVLYSADF